MDENSTQPKIHEPYLTDASEKVREDPNINKYAGQYGYSHDEQYEYMHFIDGCLRVDRVVSSVGM